MNTFSKFSSSVIEAGKRILKVVGIGGSVYTAKEIYPFGFDSNPLADYTALYMETSNKGEAVIVGYVNKSQVAAIGEARLYSLGNSGELASYAFARNTGVLELNGSEFSAVRFQNLKTQIDLLQEQINSQLPLIASGIATGGGVYTPTNVNIDLSDSESPTVKIK